MQYSNCNKEFADSECSSIPGMHADGQEYGGGSGLTDMFGLHFFLASDFHIYQLVTYMFMHGGFLCSIFSLICLPYGCLAVWLKEFGDQRNSFLLHSVWSGSRFVPGSCTVYYLCGKGYGSL